MSKIAVITGGTSGIGRETALYLAKNGCTVYELSRREEGVEGLRHIRADVTDEESVRRAVEQVCRENAIDRRAICCAASIDLKADESGLLEYCRGSNIPIRFYSADALRAVAGEFTPSAFVQRVTGVDNVCERAALLGAERLIVKKTALDGVTVALAEEKWEVRFE